MARSILPIEQGMGATFAGDWFAETDAVPRNDAAYGIALAVKICSRSLVVVGTLALIGWALHIELLTCVVHGYASMKVNTALAFVAAGAAMAAYGPMYANDGGASRTVRARSFSKRLGQCLSLIPLGLGGLSLAEDLFRADLHIDQLFIVDSITPVYPGRMAQLTAINCCLAGAALLLGSGNRSARRASRLMLGLMMASAISAMVGFLYGVHIFYGSFDYTSMALHTGVSFLVLGVGAMLQDSESSVVRVLSGSESGSLVLRRSLAGVIALPVIVGWVCLQAAQKFHIPHLGMALFAVTQVVAATVSLWMLAVFLNRHERQRVEIAQRRWEVGVALEETAKLTSSNRDLSELAATDALTGLSNRRAFEVLLRKAVSHARRHGETISVLMMDIDHFKRRNDTWGHAAGDEVLQRLGALLRENVRDPDVVCRYGGEEFLVLLPAGDGERAMEVAMRLQRVVAEQIWAGEPVTLSIGIADWSAQMESGGELVGAADNELYRAKRSGRNRICQAERAEHV
jgi:diguanylate cyclase (GGDEF)-like protein